MVPNSDAPHVDVLRLAGALRRSGEDMGASQNQGYHFGGPYNNDYSIFGVYIGVPLFRETTIWFSDMGCRV